MPDLDEHDGSPNTELPPTTARVTIEELGGGRTRMSIESRFPSTEAMERVLAIPRWWLPPTLRTWTGSRFWTVFVGPRGDVLSESLFSAPLGLSDNRELDPAAAALVEQRFAKLAIPDCPPWAKPDGSVHWFTGPEVLLCDLAGSWLWVRARTAAALDAVRVALPGKWLMRPDR